MEEKKKPATFVSRNREQLARRKVGGLSLGWRKGVKEWEGEVIVLKWSSLRDDNRSMGIFGQWVGYLARVNRFIGLDFSFVMTA